MTPEMVKAMSFIESLRHAFPPCRIRSIGALMSEQQIPFEVAQAYSEYETAKAARAKWEAAEKEAKERILSMLGYMEGDANPQPMKATAPSGVPLFEVKVSYRRGIDRTYIKKMHPDVYAQAERLTPVKELKAIKAE